MADLKNLRKVLGQLQTKYKNTIFQAEEANVINKINFQSPQLTYQFSGFSYDRVHQLYGPESSGKSSISTYIAGQLQQKFPERPVVLYLDFERTFDIEYAKNLGLNTDEDHFILIRAENGEEGFTIAEELIKTESLCCIIFDSDATCPTRTEIADEVNKASFGGSALMFSRVLRRWNILCAKYKTPLIWISQERANMNAYAHLPSTTGGYAIKFSASTRNRVTKIDNITQGGEIVGIKVRVRNYKNKTGIPFRDAEMALYFDGGFKSDDEYVDFLVRFDIFKQGGAWFTCDRWGEPIKCNGKAKVLEWLKENPEKYEELKNEITNRLLGFSEELDCHNSDPEIEEGTREKFNKEEVQYVESLAEQALDDDLLYIGLDLSYSDDYTKTVEKN